MFSRFDANTRILGLNWLSVIVLHFFFCGGFWLHRFPAGILYLNLCKFLNSQFELNLLKIQRPGHSLWLISCFIFIFSNNFLGLLPYVFTASSHLVFSFSFALVSWLTYYLIYILIEFKAFLAHLVPLGTPYLLIPLIVLIELIRGLIRPVTLRVRLVANIVAGHLLIVLLRSPLIKASWIILTLGLIVLFLLVLLERGVSLIQGYVFSLLSSLYLGERNGAKLNYLNKITSL